MKENKSLKRLNEFKIQMNEETNRLEKSLNELKKVDSMYDNFENIEEIYRNTIYRIYLELDHQGIDFWSDDFALRNAIMVHLRIRLYEGLMMLKYVGFEIMMSKSVITNKISKRKAKKLIPLIEELKVETNYLKEYDINKNLTDTLIDYFESIPEDLKQPNEITETYNKIKENVKSIGKINITDIEDNNLRKIIQKKEEEVLKSKTNIKQRTR